MVPSPERRCIIQIKQKSYKECRLLDTLCTQIKPFSLRENRFNRISTTGTLHTRFTARGNRTKQYCPSTVSLFVALYHTLTLKVLALEFKKSQAAERTKQLDFSKHRTAVMTRQVHIYRNQEDQPPSISLYCLSAFPFLQPLNIWSFISEVLLRHKLRLGTHTVSVF